MIKTCGRKQCKSYGRILNRDGLLEKLQIRRSTKMHGPGRRGVQVTLKMKVNVGREWLEKLTE